jgi:hypothetical protein
VFAKSEFDLGKFNTIQHGIDTGTNRPVKQRIRRTPLGFAYLVINAVLEQSSGLICTCQYAELAWHLANLRAVLVRFREYGLKLKPKKCELFQKEVEFLGRVVGPRGIKARTTFQFKPLSTRLMTLV